MQRRSFIQKATLLGAGAIVTPAYLSNSASAAVPVTDEYKLPDLEYAYDALEPYIDAMTMEIHHSKHHAGYTRKFNSALKENNLVNKPMEQLFASVSEYPEAIRNNGGGFYNHNLFWKNMSPKGGGQPKADLAKAIEKYFGSFEAFKEKFSKAAASRFGSGWAWLVKSNGKLVVTSTPNQDNPLMDVAGEKGIPLLALDVWEHAYYLKYQNKRGDYIAAFWNVVNWDEVTERFLASS